MGIIIDGIIIVILLLCIGIGYYRGLTGSLLKIISFVLALVIAFVLFKPIANFVVDNTNWDENLEQAIRQMVVEEESKQNNELENNTSDKNQTTNIEKGNYENKATNQEKNNKNEKTSNMSNIMLDYINEAVENAGTEAKNTIIDATARNIAVTIINVGVLIALFLISRIILLFVKGLANLITKLPVIKQFDKLGGIIYGLLEAFIIIYVILAIISFISPMISTTGIIEGINSSWLGKMFYHNNLLLNIIFSLPL